MNVVGKVGSLITQGVYSVATPFHPFGGAVDIIVVQQQDGTFRSTPWYVQFGKFQGVLKGAEKVVRINVNGVEANFHMYLDNSGEAYFVREAESVQGSENSRVSADEKEGALEHSLSIDNSQCNVSNDNVENFRLQSTLSDPGVLRDDYSSFRPDQLDRNDSDVCRFYDFQDDQSLEGELSPEYGSGRFDNLDGVDNFVEAQGSDSEMVLVSVDGHILTAPITSSEQNTENVQLVTPQFHLGPGEGNGFCEGDSEFTVTESAWNPGYITDLDASSSKSVAVDASCENGNDQVGTDDVHASGSCKDDGECALKASEDDLGNDSKGDAYRDVCIPDTPGKEHTVNVDENNVAEEMDNFENREEEVHVHQEHDCLATEAYDLSPSANNDKFRSCLDLTMSGIDETTEADDSTVKVREVPISLEEKPSQSDESSSHNGNENRPTLAHSDDGAVTGIHIAVGKTNDDDLSPSDVLLSRATESLRIVGIEDTYPESPSSGDVSVYKDDRASPVMSHETAKSSAGGDFMETESVRSEALDGQYRSSFEQERMQANDGDFTETESTRSEVPYPHVRKSSEQEHANYNPLVEISLCGHLLKPGMGLEAANEAFNSHRISEEEFRSTAATVAKNENLVIRYKEKYFLWAQAAHIVLGITAFGVDLSVESKDAIQVEQEVAPKPEETDPGSASGRRWRLWPIPFRRVKTIQSSNSSSVEEVFVDSESVSHNPSIQLTPTSINGTPTSTTGSKSPLKRIVRTNIPTNQQIESLNLKEGQNDVTFSFSTRVLGLQQVQAHIYLWKWNARIVISDVDGTITKSDVLGQFMPLVGKDWSQSGVARLFSAIKENGYQLLFLSARAIVQAYLTKSFLFNLKQDGKTLPNGPVVISPNGLFPSLFREVIRRAPHEFKIACLEDIKALFPPDYNPFYAGFGNRDTDELTYRKIGIPKGKIFIINPKGEVAINHQIDVKSYTSLHTLVNDMFPPTSMVEQEDFNSWNYWKMPVQDIDE